MPPPVDENHQVVRRRSVSLWQHSLLTIPLELKLLGANLVIMTVAVLMLFGPFRFEPTLLTDAVIVVAALGAGSIVSFVLVRLALRPEAFRRASRSTHRS